MLALTIEDKKAFTKELFMGTMFDRFQCCKVVLHHNVDYHIDGHYNIDFFDSEEQEERRKQTYAFWSELKPFVFQILKGQRLPKSFQIVLCAAPASIAQMLATSASVLTPEQVEGLYLNLHYKEDVLSLTTGSAYRVFTMDKSLDRVFEDAVVKLIRTHGIAFLQ